MEFDMLDINIRASLNLSSCIYNMIKNKKLKNAYNNEILSDTEKQVLSFLKVIMYFDYDDKFDIVEPFDIFSYIIDENNKRLSNYINNVISYYSYNHIYETNLELLHNIYYNNVKETDFNETDVFHFTFKQMVGNILLNNAYVRKFIPEEKYREYDKIFNYYKKYCTLNKSDDREEKTADIKDFLFDTFGIPIKERTEISMNNCNYILMFVMENK